MPAVDSPSLPLESWQVVDLLVALVDKSLVVFDEGDGQASGEGRYRLLETTRQYGAERLSYNAEEADALRKRHRAYYLRFAESVAPELNGPQAATHLAAIAADHENVRNALNGFVDAATNLDSNALTDGARLSVALFEFWSVRGFYVEGRDYCQKFLDLDKASGANLAPPLRTHLLRACGSFWGYLNEHANAESCLHDALMMDQAAENHNGTSETLVNLGIIARHKGDENRARDLFAQGVAEARLGDDARVLAVALTNVAHLTEDKPAQIPLHEECLAIFRKRGDSWGVAQSLGNLAWLKQNLGDEAEALVLYEQCRTIREELGDRHGLGWMMRGMAQSALAQGDRKKALDCYNHAIDIFRSISNREGLGWMQFYKGIMPLGDGVWPDNDDQAALKTIRDALRTFVASHEPNSARFAVEGVAFRHVLSDLNKAAVLWGAGRAIRNRLGTYLHLEHPLLEKIQAEARVKMGEAAWDAAFAHGETLSCDEAIALALDETDAP